jgi:tRNA-specific 2-thiouridylase
VAKRVVVGMSGGVDSSVTAYLLKQEGYEVIGITLDFLEESCQLEREDTCCSLQAFMDAREVAEKIGIRHYIVNCKLDFEEKVISCFLNEYLLGRTPNPCIICNPSVKFKILLKKAEEIQAEYIATGHYARVSRQGDRFIIKKAFDSHKDQSYFLYRLSQRHLKHLILPLGSLTKEQVRNLAKEIGLKVFKKRESQEICFIPNGNYRDFLQKKLGKKIQSGPILDKNGNVLGTHPGISYYTIGQRKGLGISAQKPLYVTSIDASRNAIIVGQDSDLYKKEFIACQTNWVSIQELTYPIEVTAKIRYMHEGEEAKITPIDKDKVKVTFKTPQRAITPGQSVVFYNEDVLVGGGVIS